MNKQNKTKQKYCCRLDQPISFAKFVCASKDLRKWPSPFPKLGWILRSRIKTLSSRMAWVLRAWSGNNVDIQDQDVFFPKFQLIHYLSNVIWWIKNIESSDEIPEIEDFK
jgi:hypothetical protein